MLNAECSHMIIRKITISSWRAIEKFERELEPNLNLLKGRNEAGKSSIVEAIGWALHRDLVGGAQIKSDISPIIPAHNPKAKPHVELLLEFPNCTATISKTLAEDSAQRECVLVVRREGVADENFDQGDAQTELKKLLASDGCAQDGSTPAALEGEVLLSAQGGSTRFLSRELSSAARAAANSVAVGEGGVLAPTSRLEKVRTALEKRVSKELFEKLKTNAIDAAKKQTDAARVRDELRELRENHAKFSHIEAQIGTLRNDIEKLKTQLSQTAPRVEETQREVEKLRARFSAQIKADSVASELRRAHDEAKTKRDDWQRRIDEIARLKTEVARASLELKSAREESETLQNELTKTTVEQDAAWQAHHDLEAQNEATRSKASAWNLAYEVCVFHRERKRAAKRVEQLEAAHKELQAAQTELEKLPAAPPAPQIAQWRRQFLELDNARRQNAHSIRLALRLQRGVSLQWQSDGGDFQTGDAQADEEFLIGAGQTISVILPGVGCIDVAGEGREVRRQTNELDAKTRELEKQLKRYEIALEALPQAFEELEARSEMEQDAKQKLQFAQHNWQSALDAGEDLDEAREVFEGWDEQWKTAREQVEKVRGSLPGEIREMTALRERDRWRETETSERTHVLKAQKKWQIAFAQLTAAKSNFSQTQAKIKNLETILERANNRLFVLESDDGEDDNSRSQTLDELNTKLYEAKLKRDEAIQKREALGAPVNEETLAHAAHDSENLRQELHRLETELAEKRAELRGHCEQDPQTEIERLEFEIETREAETLRHEARLRGLGVLQAALEAERHRLGREVGAPLNQFLSPWLSELRGKETHLEFDENGGRITGIRTGENGSTQSLPFGFHSGGMQEQTALVLRLLLARLAAQKLPSKRLPVVLDDPLTQTDTTRREGLWRVLLEASENLQILFVTCHETHLPPSNAHHISVGEWNEEVKKPKAARKPKTGKPKEKEIPALW
jgi:DNA repair exonuclease SbcCD ATPase subunit